MKYLGINLTKEVKYIYSENSNTSMKEFENECVGLMLEEFSV